MSADKPLVPKFLRQRDLEALNISASDTQTKYLQREHGFPQGRLLSPNIRGWTEQEVADWLAARPVDFKPQPPYLKRGRPRKSQPPQQAA